MATTEKNQANALISLYLHLHEQLYNKTPIINRYREKWGMIDVINSVGYERAVELMKFYFDTERTSHPISWFLYNFDKLEEVLVEKEKDRKRIKDLQKETKERVAQWKANQ